MYGWMDGDAIHSHKTTTVFHPSFFYTRLIRRSGRGGAGAHPSGHRARGGVHPEQVVSPSQGHTETNGTNNHTHATTTVFSVKLEASY